LWHKLLFNEALAKRINPKNILSSTGKKENLLINAKIGSLKNNLKVIKLVS